MKNMINILKYILIILNRILHSFLIHTIFYIKLRIKEYKYKLVILTISVNRHFVWLISSNI